MANPYVPSEIPRDANLSEAPRRVTPVASEPGFWLPIVIAIVLVIGLGYYYHGRTTMGPTMRAAHTSSASATAN